MEQDKHIKQILLNSAEGASKNFTDAVLERINALSAVGRSYHPLVPPRWQRIFLYSFLFIAFTIIVSCVLIAYTQTDAFKWIKSWEVPNLSYSKILSFIVCFWIVFAGNSLMQKKLRHSR